MESPQPVTVTTTEEAQAWRAYHDKSAGRHDLLLLLPSGGATGENAASATVQELRSSLKTEVVVENLRTRWRAQQPYTAIGQTILVGVHLNDRQARIQAQLAQVQDKVKHGETKDLFASRYEHFVMLTEEEQRMLISDPRDYLPVIDSHTAHPFSLAAKAYWHMLRDQENQAIVITGESGSGKTEAGKMVLRQLFHLSEVYARKVGHTIQGAPPPREESKVVRRVIGSMQLLARLTNAHTAINPNSTRMHKFMEFQFNRYGKLVGMETLGMMLESARVAKGPASGFGPLEQNFHIFYDMLRPGAFIKEEKERYCLLEKPRQYKYLGKLGLSKQERLLLEQDPANQLHIKTIMRDASVPANLQDDIFKILSAILLMGNLEFQQQTTTRTDTGVTIKNINVLDDCSSLLGVSADALATALVQRTRLVGSVLLADFLTVSQAAVERDNLATTLYQLLVQFIVGDINQRLSGSAKMNQTGKNAASGKTGHSIGIFDLGGLENYQLITGDSSGSKNRFWQYACNFADELLLSWVKEGVFHINPEEPNPADESIALLEDEILESMRFNISLYTHPQRGINMLVNQLTASHAANQSAEMITDTLELVQRLNQQFPPMRGKTFFNNRASMQPYSSESRIGERYAHGHTATSFGIRHYGGVNWKDKDKELRGVKVFYDTSDFLATNRQSVKQIHSLLADFVRLVFGTADFEATKNPFLASLVPKMPVVSVNPVTPALKRSGTWKDRRMSIVQTAKHRLSVTSEQNDTVTQVNALEATVVGETSSPTLSPLDADVTITEAIPERSPSILAANSNIPKEHTEIAQLHQGLTSIFSLLGKEHPARMWYMFCLRASDERSPRFLDERIRDQIKRLDISLLILRQTRTLSQTMDWQEFYDRYRTLKQFPVRTFSVSSARDMDKLREMCAEIYKQYAVIFRGGSGRVLTTETGVQLDERAWWSLERTLVLSQSRAPPPGKPNKSSPLDPAVQAAKEEVLEYDSTHSDASGNEGVDMTETIRREAILNRKRKQRTADVNVSNQRRQWLKITNILTWYIPEYTLITCGGMRRPEVRQAWREKYALCSIVFFMSCCMIFSVAFLTRILCPSDLYTKDEVEAFLKPKGAVIVHGEIYDLRRYRTENMVDFTPYIGQDVSFYFPMTTRDGFVAAECNPNGKIKAQKAACFNTSDCLTTPDFFEQAAAKQNGIKFLGPLAVKLADVEKITPTSQMFVNKRRVYDATELLRNIAQYQVHTDWNLEVLRTFIGKDATDDINKMGGLRQEIMMCLNGVYYKGILDGRDAPQCVYSGYTLMALMAVNCLIILVKFGASMQLGTVRMPEDNARYCILQVPCYTEDENSLSKTMNSLAMSTYDDEKKLLMVISDGLIKGSGNNRMTPEIVLNILGVTDAQERLTNDAVQPRFGYVSLGDGDKRVNYAKVFTGRYKLQGHVVPYLVVVKCGKESESKRAGNRGKRDSQLILMKFLNRVFFDKRMYPLDLEMYRQIRDVIGYDPSIYEYCLMVDADTEVLPDALNRLIAFMLNDTLTMGLCGETRISNETQSWVTAIQVFEYYISHFLAKAFESLFGSVTCLPGCFCMYRIKTNGKKPVPLVVADEIIDEYEENNVDTLHKKNLFSLGEDRYLTTLMLKQFPDYRNKFTSDATCKTVVPDKFSVLLSQRRRWINSTMHNLWELLLIPQLCGCLCFSMRFVVLLDFIGTAILPVSFAYLGYMIYLITTQPNTQYAFISLYMLAAVYGLQVIVFMIRMKFDMLMWMFIYILSLPVFSFILPIYAFWHFDDFSWGNTRLAAGEQKAAAHDGDGGTGGITEKQLEQKTWAEYCQEKGLPLYRESANGVVPYAKNSMTAVKTANMYPEKSTPPTQARQASLKVNTVKPKAARTGGAASPRLLAESPFTPTFPEAAAETPAPAQLFPPVLLPLPASVSKTLGKNVLKQVALVIRSDHSGNFTKKSVRERVEQELRAIVGQYDQEEGLNRIPPDVRALMLESLDLSTEVTRREWVNKCIVWTFQEIQGHNQE